MKKKILTYVFLFVCAYTLMVMAEDVLFSVFGKVSSYMSGNSFYSLQSEDLIIFQNRIIILGIGYLIYNKVKKS